MGNCVHCGGLIYGEGLVCFRCKGLGTKREIYDREEGPQDPGGFSEHYLGSANYKKLRKQRTSSTNSDVQNDLT